MTDSTLRDLIADDAYAMSFQSMGQYRTALLKAARTTPQQQAEPVASNCFECGQYTKKCLCTPRPGVGQPSVVEVGGEDQL